MMRMAAQTCWCRSSDLLRESGYGTGQTLEAFQPLLAPSACRGAVDQVGDRPGRLELGTKPIPTDASVGTPLHIRGLTAYSLNPVRFFAETAPNFYTVRRCYLFA